MKDNSRFLAKKKLELNLFPNNVGGLGMRKLENIILG